MSGAMRLRQLRRMQDLTQIQLEDKAKGGRGTILRIERGLMSPQPSLIIKILKALDAMDRATEFLVMHALEEGSVQIHLNQLDDADADAAIGLYLRGLGAEHQFDAEHQSEDQLSLYKTESLEG